MAGKTKPGKPVKSINIKLRMINDLIDVTGSAKDSWNPAEISDDMKAIAYIHDLADTWNPAQLNEALKYLGFATIDSWNPAIIEETKNKLVKYFLPTDASGNPIELDLKGSLPYEVTALTIGLLPIQDLHGYNSPWSGGSGKNKIVLKDYTASGNGVTITSIKDDDGNVIGYDLDGTATAGQDFYINSGAINLPSQTWYATVGTDTYVGVQLVLTPSYTGIKPSGTYNGSITSSYVGVANGTVCNHLKIYPMICDNAITDKSFAPYSNICPITGRDSVTLTLNTEDTEITFEQTVYGGTVNVLEGGTSSTYGYIASYDGEELPGAWISDRDAYVAGTTPTTGAKVAYILATPEALTTSAEEITLINGENTLSTDGDNINITYKAILNS